MNLYTMLNLLFKVWCSCYRRNKNNNTSNNTSSSNLPHVLLLSHLPTEILSKIILELLNERALMKSISGTPQRGLLSIYKPLSELSTNRMIPLIQTNKFFLSTCLDCNIESFLLASAPFQIWGIYALFGFVQNKTVCFYWKYATV